MDIVDITHQPISVENYSNQVTSPSCGAISLFIGTTRDSFESKSVAHLEYEAYEAMAKLEMLKICGTIRLKWPSVLNVAVVHRIGIVPITEASVIIAISSPHRSEAMAATQFAIDQVKATVPIWKKEYYCDGSFSWKENKECEWTSQS